MRTIILSYAITNLVCTSVMALLWLQNRKRFAGIGFWLGHYAAIFAAVVLLALRGILPDFLSIVIANALVIFGLILLYTGLERFVGKPGSQIHNYILLAVFVLVHAYFTYIHPSLLARNINVSVGMFIGAFQIAWFIFHGPGADASFNMRSLGVIIIFYCLISVARIIMGLIVDPGNDFLKSNSDSLVFLFYQTFQVALTLNLFLKVNRRLVVDLERDITALKQSEDKIKSLAKFPDENPNPVVRIGGDGNVLYANKAAGLLLPSFSSAVDSPPIPALWRDKFAQALASQAGQAIEVEHKGFVYALDVIPVTEGGYINVYARDITASKLAEEQLRYQAALLANVNDAIVASNAQYQLTAWNAAAESLYGWKAEEVLGRNGLEIVRTEWSAADAEEMRRVIAEMGRWRGEATQMRKDGTRIPVEVSSMVLRDDSGQITGYVSVNRDITGRKQTEEELHRAKEALERLNIELQTALIREQQLARIDPLTGVNNRRHLFELVERAFEVATRYQQPLSVIMLDFDHFKGINDTFGHAVGDQILEHVTQVACAELRSADVIGRYGGEEFVILLPMTNAQQAYLLAERIREGAAAIRMPTPKGDAAVTLSIGIAEATLAPQDESVENVIRLADEAMYAAKQAGRNRTVISDPK